MSPASRIPDGGVAVVGWVAEKERRSDSKTELVPAWRPDGGCNACWGACIVVVVVVVAVVVVVVGGGGLTGVAKRRKMGLG